MFTTKPMISWNNPSTQFPIAVEKLETMSTFRGMCYPKVIELKVAFTWKIPPIVHPSRIVIKMLETRDPKSCKKIKLMATENKIMMTFLSLNRMVSAFKHLLSSEVSTPNLVQVALSYIIILPTK